MSSTQADKPTTILVPVDFSSRSDKAVGYAAMLARALGSSILLTTNLNLPEREALEEFARDERITIEEAAEARLRGTGAELCAGVKTAITLCAAQYPADGILDVADREHVDMIVIASHGRAGMSRWLLGSVAEKVSRAASVPVVIVPAHETD